MRFYFNALNLSSSWEGNFLNNMECRFLRILLFISDADFLHESESRKTNSCLGMILKLHLVSKSPADWWKDRLSDCQAPPPSLGFWVSRSGVKAEESAFLTSLAGVVGKPMLLAWDAHTENQRSKASWCPNNEKWPTGYPLHHGLLTFKPAFFQ